MNCARDSFRKLYGDELADQVEQRRVKSDPPPRARRTDWNPMKISCCLIIRDEMANLPRLWDSVRPHVDEICVLDTGSTDGSAEWCRERADKWSHTDRCNDASGRIVDFSLARNLNLAMASHDVVLWLDGDDELQGGANLRKLVSEAPAATTSQAWALLAEYEYDQDAAGRPITVQWRERLVSPARCFEWRGPVHEGLLGKAGTSVQHIQTDAFRVVHRRRQVGKTADPERNLRILRAWFAAHGESDARLMHYFGSELLLNKHIGEARYWLRRHVVCAPWSDERCLSLLHLARVELAFGDHAEAARWALEATATKTWPEPWWLLGQAYLGLSELGLDAEYNLRRGLHALEQGFRYDSDPRSRTLLMTDPQARYEAHGWLAPALAKVGRIDDAILSAQAGLSGMPELGHLTQNLGEWRKAKVLAAVSELEQSGTVPANTTEVVGLALQGAFKRHERALPTGSQVDTPRLSPPRVPQPRKLMAHGAGTLRIAFWLGHQLEPWTPETLERDGMGGSETMAWELSKRLAKLGHRVQVFAHTPPGSQFIYDEVEWYDAEKFQHMGDVDVLIVSRQCEAVTLPHTAKARVLWVHDVHCGPAFTPAIASKFDFVWCLSNWHKGFFCSVYPWLNPDKVEVTRNGISPERFASGADRSDLEGRGRNPHRAIYSSSPDRGLAEAVAAWPAVRAAIPDAELHCYYGFDNWERSLQLGGENGLPQCSRAALEALKKAVAETPGVVMHGRVNQKQLAEAMLGAGVWFYPTWFSETSCITAMEAQAAGLICVCPETAALGETVAVRTWTGDLVRDAIGALGRGVGDRLPRVLFHDGAQERFSLDTLALDWQKRLTELVREAEERVVPKFMEAAQ
jgi:glycosyltransferase involved in cell wall biosynthesis